MKPTRLMRARRHRAETGHRMSGRGKPHSFQIKQGTQPREVHTMMNREQAIAYGRHIGVRWHIYNSNGCLVGGTKTLEQGQAMKRRFEIEERSNPWTHGTTRFEIREAK